MSEEQQHNQVQQQQQQQHHHHHQQQQQQQQQQQHGHGQQPPQWSTGPQYQPQGGFWSRPAATLTANEMRRVVRHGVAEGVLIAGLFLFFLSFVGGLAGLSCIGQSLERSSPYSSR